MNKLCSSSAKNGRMCTHNAICNTINENKPLCYYHTILFFDINDESQLQVVMDNQKKRKFSLDEEIIEESHSDTTQKNKKMKLSKKKNDSSSYSISEDDCEDDCENDCESWGIDENDMSSFTEENDMSSFTEENDEENDGGSYWFDNDIGDDEFVLSNESNESNEHYKHNQNSENNSQNQHDNDIDLNMITPIELKNKIQTYEQYNYVYGQLDKLRLEYENMIDGYNNNKLDVMNMMLFDNKNAHYKNTIANYTRMINSAYDIINKIDEFKKELNNVV